MKGTGGRDKKTDDGVERDGENFSLREIRRERDRNVTLCISTQSMIASKVPTTFKTPKFDAIPSMHPKASEPNADGLHVLCTNGRNNIRITTRILCIVQDVDQNRADEATKN